ncbi:MAG: hypothetical protein OXR73_03815 [Myxococcales bacterium]|nr:hypothetical protein [Myxococcales bacterium]
MTITTRTLAACSFQVGLAFSLTLTVHGQETPAPKPPAAAPRAQQEAPNAAQSKEAIEQETSPGSQGQTSSQSSPPAAQTPAPAQTPAAPAETQPPPAAPGAGQSPPGSEANQVTGNSVPAPGPTPSTPPPSHSTASPAAGAQPQASAPSEQQAKAAWAARIRMAQARRAAAQRAVQHAEEPLPPPEEPWLRFGVGGLGRIHLDDAFDLFDYSDVVAGPEVFLSADILDLTDSLVLAGEIGYAFHATEATGLRGGLFTTRIRDHRPHAGINVRLKVLSVLQPYLRLLVGIDETRTELEIPSENFLAENEETNVFGRLGLGFTLRFPPGKLQTRALPNATIGLRGEFGYTLAPTVPLKLEDPPEGDNPIPIQFADLGELSLSDPYFLISLVAAI